MQVHYLRVPIVTKQSIHQDVSTFPEAPVSGFSKRPGARPDVEPGMPFGHAWFNTAALQEQLE